MISPTSPPPPKKRESLKFLLLLLQHLDAQQLDFITTQVSRNDVNLVVTVATLLTFYLMPTFVTTDNAVVCVVGSQAKAVF